MDQWFTAADWHGLFVPEMSLLEVVIRGALVYLSLCLMLRVVLKRQSGRVSLSDLLVVTLVAGVCRNPLIKDAYSITDGMLVVAMVLACSYAMDWLSFHVGFIHQLLHAPPRPLIRNGVILRENLGHELLTEAQLRSLLRKEGVASPEQVAEANMEGDGRLSVIKKEDEPGERNGTAAVSNGHNGHPVEPPPGAHAAGEVSDFLQAAKRLQRKLQWHQQQITEIRHTLSRFGVRTGGLLRRDFPANGNARAAEPTAEERE